MTHPIELLAPAGSLPVALAALDAGADAVYCGMKKFNARERSDNFSCDDMSRLIAYAHKTGRKVYITFNTLIKESELADAAQTLAELDSLRPDAVIVQDIGALRMIRDHFPALTIHASTQMALHDSDAVKTAAEMGAKRVILERQITMEELERIAAESPVELEVFVHGALCVCLSGTCLFSSWLGGASGNRGRCKQPCRRLFRSDCAKNAFYLSTRDLAAIRLIPKFRELGIASLKIEGRLRKADYVANVVAAYRKALDGAPEEDVLELLNRTCSRERSLGFYTPDSMRSLIRPDAPGGVGQFCGRVRRILHDSFEAELTGRLHIGDNIRVQSAAGDEGEALTVLEMFIGKRPVKKAFPGQLCRIPFRGKTIFENGILYRIGETHDTMEKRCASLPLQGPVLDLELQLSATGLTVSAASRRQHFPVQTEPAAKHAFSAEELTALFRSLPDTPFSTGRIAAEADGSYFLRRDHQKALKRAFQEWANREISVQQLRETSYRKAEQLLNDSRMHTPLPPPEHPRTVFFVRPGTVPEAENGIIAEELNANPDPARECILPFFTPETELPALIKRIADAVNAGVRVFRATSLSHFHILNQFPGIEIRTAPPLPVANSFAARELQRLGAAAVHAHIELSETDVEALIRNSPLPVEIYCQGHPVLLATRAETAEIRTLADLHGETFLVRKTDGLTLLHPAAAMSVVPRIPADRIIDLRTDGSPNAVSKFNWECGLA